MSHFQTFSVDFRATSSILAKPFIQSITVDNRAYLHFHVTSPHLSKIFSTTVKVTLAQDTTWQNGGVKRSYSWAFCLKQWWAFCTEGIILFFWTHTTHSSVDSSQLNENDMGLRKTISLVVKSLQIPITVRMTQIIALQAWPPNYINLAENLAQPDL